MSRRVYLLGVGLALVALALAVTDWALSLQPEATEANVKRIRKGLTLRVRGSAEGSSYADGQSLGGPDARPLQPRRQRPCAGTG